MLFVPRSMLFYPGYFEEKYDKKTELSDHVILPSYYLHRLMDKFSPDESIYLAYLTNTENNKQYVVSIGTPHFYDKTTAFIPSWILDILGCQENSDTPVKIEKCNDNLPLATKIVIKHFDKISNDLDSVKCFENTLQNLFTLQKGITFPVKIPECDNQEFLAFIEDLEPSNICRTHDGELTVEFIYDNDEFTEINDDNKTNYTDESQEIESEQPIETTEEIPEISVEERRRLVRESWLNKFNNNSNIAHGNN
jgi:hypothetical protein